jgi:hypothetical protein
MDRLLRQEKSKEELRVQRQQSRNASVRLKILAKIKMLKPSIFFTASQIRHETSENLLSLVHKAHLTQKQKQSATKI